MERVRLDGTDQWIYPAGTSRDNPILLRLDGGPGGTEVDNVRRYSELNFERTALRLECPVFIGNGRYDLTCVAEIADRWFRKIEAPVKNLVWFENSGRREAAVTGTEGLWSSGRSWSDSVCRSAKKQDAAKHPGCPPRLPNHGRVKDFF